MICWFEQLCCLPGFNLKWVQPYVFKAVFIHCFYTASTTGYLYTIIHSGTVNKLITELHLLSIWTFVGKLWNFHKIYRTQQSNWLQFFLIFFLLWNNCSIGYLSCPVYLTICIWCVCVCMCVCLCVCLCVCMCLQVFVYTYENVCLPNVSFTISIILIIKHHPCYCHRPHHHHTITIISTLLAFMYVLYINSHQQRHNFIIRVLSWPH